MTGEHRIVFAVAIGSALGALTRFAISLAMLDMMAGFPATTLVANIIGSFAIGWVAASCGAGGRWPLSPLAYQFAVTGFCGGLTTFSLFSLEVFLLIDAGAYANAGGYVAVSLVLWLLAVWAGYAVGVRKPG